jgi:hypothetical protein
MADPPPIPDNVQTREAYDQHRTNPQCATCHAHMDPLGFAFENFDAVGRHRTTEAGRPVNTAGLIPNLDGKDVAFTGAPGVVNALVASQEARTCLATQWMLYALARPLTPSDDASLKTVRDALERSSLDLRELAVAIVKTDAFRVRAAATGEVTE